MIKRTQKQLICENRLAYRKKSTGRPVFMDAIDEKFVLECIETKATAHGRRHDAVMYLNHRVKKKDFLKLVNYSRQRRNLKPIKSSTTVYNRARPVNSRSVQEKRHLGLGLFCCKKPPKAESIDNELTHHQRAHEKNVMVDNGSVKGEYEFTSVISSDDKAYVCPQTSTGVQSARNLKVFQPTEPIWRCTDQLCAQIKLILKMIKNHLPVFRPRVIELTDGGPGVSVGNHDVQFRLAERARIINADYLIRLHLASGDSSQNEVGRCQSYLGDAICDGGSISWEYKLPFEGIPEDKLKEMSSEQLEESELMRH